jgi:HNH endonuclease
MDSATIARIRLRANHRCEYCQLPQAAIESRLQIEHIVARQHGGSDAEDNLCLACDRCNLYKGPNLTSIDPVTRAVVRLFDPRRDIWTNHFRLYGARIEGLTPTGRATAALLQVNVSKRLDLRQSLIEEEGVDS